MPKATNTSTKKNSKSTKPEVKTKAKPKTKTKKKTKASISTKIKGVSLTSSGNYRARIWNKNDGVLVCIGTYSDPDKAKRAYRKAYLNIHGKYPKN